MPFRPRHVHAFVATPAYDGRVYTDYALSLAESMQAATAAGIRCTASLMANGAFIDLARNNFVRLFLESQCTHLFFIDADLKWQPQGFVGLLQSGHKVCGGAYRRRQEPEDYPIRWMEHPKMGGLWLEDDWVMCDRAATGFLCIERSVIETMAERAPVVKIFGQPESPRLFYTQYMEDGRFMGEDYAWCDDYLKQFQDPIRVWPNLKFKHGTYECNFYEYLQRKIEEHETRQQSNAA